MAWVIDQIADEETRTTTEYENLHAYVVWFW